MTLTSETRPAATGAAFRLRFLSFVGERHPLALSVASDAFDSVTGDLQSHGAATAEAIDAVRGPLLEALERGLAAALFKGGGLPSPTPAVSMEIRMEQARRQIVEDCAGFLRRESIAASLTRDERREILRGMILTRAVDNRLKIFFSGGEVRYGKTSFQGKGFRSLGQEAIYAAAIRLRRGSSFRSENADTPPAERWHGDVVAPLIRDLGVALAMHPEKETVRMVLSAQMGKGGPPMNGKDLHVGDFSRGILPASAPLTISTLTAAGLAMGFSREIRDERTGEQGPRVAISFIGEGGSSLGEWHEAVNLCAARRLPAVFCLQNNQTALATPVHEQSSVRMFADKAQGYGIPGITIDGTDPDAIAAAFTWAVERARSGLGPALIELISMRMCGHAHHDDMLYLGKETPPGWEYPPLSEQGYADPEAWTFWSAKDPISTYAARLEAEGIVEADEVARWKADCQSLVDVEARAVIEAPWPDPELAGVGVLDGEPPRRRLEVLDKEKSAAVELQLPALDPGPPFDPKGRTFLEAVMLGVKDALQSDPRVFVYGEDVGGKYGNAFLLLRPLLNEFGDRILNSILAEGAVLGVCVGAALAGQRPIGEIQFNDFVATGFNQLVNNAAKIRYRWGASVPMVVRMPWGGLRHAGPYHSQNTEPWFYRTPGLKIVTPSTPHDARALMAAAVADPDPVLYYEHIALYRDPRIKQALSDDRPAPLPIGKAALRRAGEDLAIISYGAYVHSAMRVAEKLA
ncbi:MAG: thiamine pyrophosphate-dependent enzyme, partial [Acidobacteriota bacterium]